MRFLNLVLSVLLMVAAGPIRAYGQTHERPPPEGQFEPYHEHRDTHLGHDHFYPDRGSIVREVPKEAATVSYAGLSYRFFEGIWYEPRGPAFMVVAPPIGLVVQSLPTFATLLARGGQVYIYCNDTFYRPRPDVRGYEVVNDPAEASFQAARESLAGTSAIHAAAGPPAVAPSAVAVGATSAVAPASPAQAVATPLEEAAKVSAPTPTSAPGAPVPPAAGSAAPIAALPSAASAAPSTPSPSTGMTAAGLKVSLNPKQGQSAEQQARDRYECYRFAVAQSGFDPMRGSNNASQSEYDRAQAACFDARGYALR